MDLQSIELFNIEPAKLDELLAMGWFRMQQTIFTTDILYFNGLEYNAVWLRVNLVNFKPDKKCKSLILKNNEFKIEIIRSGITQQHEILYSRYKESLVFEGAASLQWLLFGNSRRNVFNTYAINVFDGHKMIATGFFDLGSNSAAGIVSIYDPLYKKYSLGKYIIYKKMLYCMHQNFKYFYPGYYVPGYPIFDYKLELGTSSLEYFEPRRKEWLPIRRLNT